MVVTFTAYHGGCFKGFQLMASVKTIASWAYDHATSPLRLLLARNIYDSLCKTLASLVSSLRM